MAKKQFDKKIEEIYKGLSNEEKMNYKAKEDKFIKLSLIMGIISSTIAIVAIICTVLYFENPMVVLIAVIGAICAFFAICMLVPVAKEIEADDEIKIKSYIVRLEKKLQNKIYYRLAVDKIKSVAIIDSYTEYSDKLHAVLNYQEIIQTRVYKFKVDYTDGTSKIITAAEGSEEYSILITHVKNSTENRNDLPNNNIEKLREYKKLLDDGIITQEEFDAKKKELLP